MKLITKEGTIFSRLNKAKKNEKQNNIKSSTFKETRRNTDHHPFARITNLALVEFPRNRASPKIDLRNYNRLSELYNRTYVIVASSPSAITGHRSAKLAIKPYL